MDPLSPDEFALFEQLCIRLNFKQIEELGNLLMCGSNIKLEYLGEILLKQASEQKEDNEPDVFV